jgi:hypothetical protein
MNVFSLRAIKAVMNEHGVVASRRAQPIDPTEEVFLLDHEDFQRVDEDWLVRDLMIALPHNKVWVVEDGPKWKGNPL